MKSFNEKWDQIERKLEELVELDSKREALIKELKMSLEIKKICPDAFDHGPCKTRIKLKQGRDLWESLTVVRGDGSKVVFTDRSNFPKALFDSTLTGTERQKLSFKRIKERRMERKKELMEASLKSDI